MSDFERKFGKYAVRDLSLKLIILYLAGYALYFFNSQIIFYLTLNPYAIVHGQIHEQSVLYSDHAVFLLQHRHVAGTRVGSVAL